jgi:hypothetical protein
MLTLRESVGMPGYTDKSRGYLRLAVENYKRSSRTEDPGLKRELLQMAAAYRDLALQIDDPEKWRAKLTESREAKLK